MALLAEHGAELLRAVWGQLEQDIGSEVHGPPEGLRCEIRHPRAEVSVELITVPAPEALPEAHFVAAVCGPPDPPRGEPPWPAS